MKHYIGKIKTQCGEYEFHTAIRFKTDKEPRDYLNTLAAEFFGEKENEEAMFAHYFNHGEVACSGASWQQVSFEVYNTITILNELSINEGEA